MTIRLFYNLLYRRLLSIFVIILAANLTWMGNVGAVEVNSENASADYEVPESKEAVREMVSKLSDESVRSLLIDRLDAVADSKSLEKENSAGVLGGLAEAFETYRVNAWQMLRSSFEIPSKLSSLSADISTEAGPGGVSGLFLYLVLAIVLGVVAERLVVALFRKKKQKLIDQYSTKLSEILKILYTRLSIDIFAVLAMWGMAYLVIKSAFGENQITVATAYVPISALLGYWMGFVICRFFFAPSRPELRICSTSDERAMRMTQSFSLLAAYILMVHNTYYLLLLISEKHHGGWEFMAPIGFYLNLSLYLFAGLTIVYNREALTEVLIQNKKRVFLAIGEAEPNDISWFADNWPKIALLLIAAKYFLVEVVINSAGVGSYSTAAVYITFITIFLWPGVDANISLFVARGIDVPEDETEAAGKARRKMQQGLLRVGRIVVVGVVSYALAKLWGLNILDLAEAGLGAQAAAVLVELLFVLIFAYLCWELVSIVIGRWLVLEGGYAEEEEEGGGEIGGVGLSRVATLLPLVRKTAQFLIVVISIIMILNQWGVNIGPILAGAGVVGLAIGFGAQTLVKDIVSGLFFLADDAFRVGEYIDVEGTMGNVEKISLRSLRLRHHRGLVHTIPYGEIPKLTNYSRDWVIMKLRFKVPFDTDIHKVKKIFKQIGADLLEHEELGPDFLQPFKSQGVAEVDDNGIVVRGKFMAKPGKQFMIRKEVYVRVQKAFEAANIPFARKQVMVHIQGVDNVDDLDKEDLRNIGAAAAEAAEEPEQTDNQKKPNNI